MRALVSLLVVVVGAGCSRAAPPLEVAVSAAWPGAHADAVDAQVVAPLARALAGIDGVAHVEGAAWPGVGAVRLVLRPKAALDTLYAVRAAATAEMTRASLPVGVSPALGPAGHRVVLRAVVEGATRSELDLRTIADWTVRPALLTVPGVADARVAGGRVARILVELDPARAALAGVSSVDVERAVAPGVGERGLRLPRLEELERLKVGERGGVPVLVRDVARVAVDGAPPASLAWTREGRRVLVELVARDNVRPEEVAARAWEKLTHLALPPGVTVRPLDLEPAPLSFRVQLPPGLLAPVVERVGHALLAAARAEEVPCALVVGLRDDGNAFAPPAGEARLVVAPGREPAERAAAIAARLRAVPGVALLDLDGPRTAVLRPRTGRLLGVSTADAARVVEAIRRGLGTVTVEGLAELPSLDVTPDRAQLARLGLEHDAVSRVVAETLEGRVVGLAQLGAQRLDVVVRSGPGGDGPLALAAVTLPGRDGAPVPLATVARIEGQLRPALRLRTDGSPAVILHAWDASAAAVRDLARTVLLPPGAVLQWEPRE